MSKSSPNRSSSPSTRAPTSSTSPASGSLSWPSSVPSPSASSRSSTCKHQARKRDGNNVSAALLLLRLLLTPRHRWRLLWHCLRLFHQHGPVLRYGHFAV